MAQLDFIFSIEHKPGTHIGSHQHNCHELVYYIHGEGTTLIGDIPYRFGPHCYSLISPGVNHDEHHNSLARIVCIGFQPRRALQKLPVFDREDEHFPIHDLILCMLEEFNQKKPYYEDKLDLLAGELWIELCRRNYSVDRSSGDAVAEKLRYVLNYMDEHFQQQMTINTLSRMAGYSYDRFRHLFTEINGISPKQYLLRKRIDRARSLLTETNLPIATVALDSGFSSDAQFCSLFRRESGQSPRQFRLSKSSKR